jgi:hypothetical protein
MRSPQRRVPQFFTPYEEKALREANWVVMRITEFATRSVDIDGYAFTFTLYPNGEWCVKNKDLTVIHKSHPETIVGALLEILHWTTGVEKRHAEV